MPKILIVDDNEDNRDVLSRRLKKRGFETSIAIGGKEAIAAVDDERPDLVLMDMNMPELDGWEATKMIREQGNQVPVIALTAHAMTGDRERAIEAGCTEYHTKPVEMETLLGLIEKLLSDSAETQ